MNYYGKWTSDYKAGRHLPLAHSHDAAGVDAKMKILQEQSKRIMGDYDSFLIIHVSGNIVDRTGAIIGKA